MINIFPINQYVLYTMFGVTDDYDFNSLAISLTNDENFWGELKY